MSHFSHDAQHNVFEDEMTALGLGGGAVQPLRQQLVALAAGAIAMVLIAGLAAVREPYGSAGDVGGQRWAVVQAQVALNQ
jgi:hypothetical protein